MKEHLLVCSGTTTANKHYKCGLSVWDILHVALHLIFPFQEDPLVDCSSLSPQHSSPSGSLS